jgi:hypothetical protein
MNLFSKSFGVMTTWALVAAGFSSTNVLAVEKVGVGLRLSSNYSWATQSDFYFTSDEIKPEFAVSAGATLQLEIGNGWDLAIDALFTRSHLFFLSNTYDIDAYRLAFSSIDVPIVLYFSPIPQIFIGVGGYSSFGIGKIGRMGSFSYSTATSTYQSSSSSYAAEGWKRVSFGGVAAIGTQGAFEGQELYLEARLYWGFSDRLVNQAQDLRNRWMDVGVGLIF